MKRDFQILTVLSAVLLLVTESHYWLYTPSDVVLADLLMVDGYRAMFTLNIPTYLMLVVARLLVLFGLFSFHSVARSLFVALTALSFALAFVAGYRVASPFQVALAYPAAMIDGAIIAMAYFSPLKLEFRRNAA